MKVVSRASKVAYDVLARRLVFPRFNADRNRSNLVRVRREASVENRRPTVLVFAPKKIPTVRAALRIFDRAPIAASNLFL